MCEALNGKTFYLHSVHPKPPSGPFPPSALSNTYITFNGEEGGVKFTSPINYAGASYKVSQDGTSVVFSGAGWTERGLASVAGDDEQGTLRRSFTEAEKLLQDFSHGSFGLVVADDCSALVLSNANTGSELSFRTEKPHELC
jgi:hypothetical protein